MLEVFADAIDPSSDGQKNDKHLGYSVEQSMLNNLHELIPFRRVIASRYGSCLF
ncbi:MAG: hypothetical protein HC878_18065 [Leptolyngbyaceae cyanobacterium SL_5_14]|nr:hypothetical protein [Leptolyngbyaceae cyanobacterium SL_5_14]